MALEFLSAQNLILFGTAFFTASVSGALGMVGGNILLAVMAQFYRMEALIPLHGMIQLVSNTSRVGFLLRYVNWKAGTPFIAGALVGGTAGSFFVTALPEHIFKIILGSFILWSVFKPKPKKKIEIKGKWYLVGALSAFASLFIGAIGVLVGAFFVSEGFEKKELTATQAICQASVHSIKIMVFFSIGFVLAPYLSTFLGMIVMTILGTYFGTRILDKIPEKTFYLVLKTIILILTARMIVSGLMYYF